MGGGERRGKGGSGSVRRGWPRGRGGGRRGSRRGGEGVKGEVKECRVVEDGKAVRRGEGNRDVG